MERLENYLLNIFLQKVLIIGIEISKLLILWIGFKKKKLGRREKKSVVAWDCILYVENAITLAEDMRGNIKNGWRKASKF